jgi:hypothetical protein
VHDGTYADYVMDAPWARDLGLVGDAAPVGLGPYPRYGRAVATGAGASGLGAADVAGAQTRAILGELGYDDAEVDKLFATGVVGEPSAR